MPSAGADATLDKLIGLTEQLECMEGVEILKKAKGMVVHLEDGTNGMQLVHYMLRFRIQACLN